MRKNILEKKIGQNDSNDSGISKKASCYWQNGWSAHFLDLYFHLKIKIGEITRNMISLWDFTNVYY